MLKSRLNDMLLDIARFEGITLKEAYSMLEEYINAAQRSQEPMVRTWWEKAPHEGDSITVEEFLTYVDQIGTENGKTPMNYWWKMKCVVQGTVSVSPHKNS